MSNKVLLDQITDCAASLRTRCGWIMVDLVNLTARPEWTTQADDALREAESTLNKTLAAITRARNILADKPVEVHNV